MRALAPVLALILTACQPTTAPAPMGLAATEPVDSRFRCTDGTAITVRFTGERAVLDGPDGLAVQLDQQPSGSGIRYAGAEHSLSGKGPELRWNAPDAAERVCTQIEEEAVADDPLTGTNWQLVSFQSSDDAIGTTAPDAPERYTIAFEPEGRLALRLDCNRGMGQWRADGASLSLTGGAMTRAMCPAGSWDTRIARDLGTIRSYVIRDGDLYLALMADAGIYRFTPLP